jgi:hypothetical protein
MKFYKPTLESHGVAGTTGGLAHDTGDLSSTAPLGGTNESFIMEPNCGIYIKKDNEYKYEFDCQPGAIYCLATLWIGTGITAGPATISVGGCAFYVFTDATTWTGSSFVATQCIHSCVVIADTTGVISVTYGNMTATSLSSVKISVQKFSSGVTKREPTCKDLEAELELLRKRLDALTFHDNTTDGSRTSRVEDGQIKAKTTTLSKGSRASRSSGSLTKVWVDGKNGDSSVGRFIYIDDDHRIVHEDEPVVHE